MIKRIPKLRGRGKNIFQSFQLKSVPINLKLIEKHYVDEEIVSKETLAEKGLAKFNKGEKPSVKILASGEITKKITVSGCAVSKSARVKIEKVGGTINSL